MLEIGGVDRNFGGGYITLAITEKRSCHNCGEWVESNGVVRMYRCGKWVL